MEDPGFCPRSQLTSAGLKVAKADFLSLASLTLVQDWCLLMDNRSTSHELDISTNSRRKQCFENSKMSKLCLQDAEI